MADIASTLILRIRALNDTGRAFGEVHKGLLGLSAAAAGVGIAAGLGSAVKQAVEFQSVTQTLANNTNMGAAGLEAMRKNALALATTTGQDPAKIAEGYMRIANHAYAGAAATNILTAATKNAAATNGDAADNANILAGVLREYNVSSVDLAAKTDLATRYMDVLHNAVAGSNWTMKDFVEGTKRAIATAGTFGVPLSQVSAQLAILSEHGFPSAHTAAQNWAGMLRSLEAPTKKGLDGMAALSVATGVNLVGDIQKLQQNGAFLPQFLADIQAATGGDFNKIRQIMPQSSYATALVALERNRGQLGAVQRTTDAAAAGRPIPGMTGTTEAFAAQQKTVAAQMANLEQTAHVLSITLGTLLLPTVARLAQTLAGGLSVALALVQHPTDGMRSALMQAAIVADAARQTVSGLVGAAQRLLAPLAQGSVHLQVHRDALVRVGEAAAILAALFIAVRTVSLAFTLATGALTLGMGFGRLAVVAKTLALVVYHGVVAVARAELLVFRGVVLAFGLAKAAVTAIIWGASAATQAFRLEAILARGVLAIWTGLQWLFNAAMAANPIGLVIIATAAFAAAVIWAYKNVGWFHDLVNGLWDFLANQLGPTVKDLATWFTDHLGKAISDVADLIGTLTNSIGGLLDAVGSLPGASTFGLGGDHAKHAAAVKAHTDALRTHQEVARQAARQAPTGTPPSGGPGQLQLPGGFDPSKLMATLSGFLSMDQLAKIAGGGAIPGVPAGMSSAQVDALVKAGGGGSKGLAATLIDQAKTQFAADKMMNSGAVGTDAATIVALERRFGLTAQAAKDQTLYAARSTATDIKADDRSNRVNLAGQLQSARDQLQALLRQGDTAGAARERQQFIALDTQKYLQSGMAPDLARHLAAQEGAKVGTGGLVLRGGLKPFASGGPFSGFASQQQAGFGGQGIISFGTLASSSNAERLRQAERQIAALQEQLAAKEQENGLLVDQNRLLTQIAGHGAGTEQHTQRLASSIDRPVQSLSSALKGGGVMLHPR